MISSSRSNGGPVLEQMCIAGCLQDGGMRPPCVLVS